MSESEWCKHWALTTKTSSTCDRYDCVLSPTLPDCVYNSSAPPSRVWSGDWNTSGGAATSGLLGSKTPGWLKDPVELRGEVCLAFATNTSSCLALFVVNIASHRALTRIHAVVEDHLCKHTSALAASDFFLLAFLLDSFCRFIMPSRRQWLWGL